MLQLNNLSQVGLKRTLRPTYGLVQATPKAGFLDMGWNRNTPIWPGMVLQRSSAVVAYAENAQSYAAGDTFAPASQTQTGFPSGGQNAYTLAGGNTATGTAGVLGGSAASANTNGLVPAGLCAQYIGGDDLDELLTQGTNALACWVLGGDSEFEVDAPAFDPTCNWATADPGTGADVLIYARLANNPAVGGLNGTGGPANTFGLQGQLVLATGSSTLANDSTLISNQPVARLVQVNSAYSLTIAGLLPRHSL